MQSINEAETRAELIDPVLFCPVWVPSLRRSTVLIGLGFHLSLELTMNLFIFQWLMIGILASHLFTPLRGEEAPKQKTRSSNERTAGS